ncbi:MAG TPA: class I SAM-dependent methyltransferase [Polyangiaceae bacterium]|nr:class I SAM-dependent methyltransferase [Polyangiaceae bacterium]
MSLANDGGAAYLDVRYSAEKKPYTEYPAKLVRFLGERYLSAHRGGKLLDVGCGRGEFLHHFAREGFDAIGMDRSRPAEPRYSEPVVVGDYSKGGLPFADGHFQVVFDKSVLEHVADPTPLLAECHRVLAPGGTLLSLVPDFRAQWRHFYDDWTHVHPYTLPGLTECIACHGFRVREARHFRQLPHLWERPWLRPLSDLCVLLPDVFKTSKFVRFSKEWMLLVVAEKP